MTTTKAGQARAPLIEDAVSHFPAFADMDDDALQTVLAWGSLRQYARGTQIFRQGDAADEFFMMIDGFARLQRTTEQGDQAVLHHVPPGWLFGITKVTESETHNVAAKAATDCTVMAWKSDAWDRIAAQYPGFVSEAKQTMGIRMRELAEKVVDLATRSVEQRIARALLRMTEQAGHATPLGTEIAFPMTRQDIAESTGATMHSVSRIMSRWQRNGIVLSKRRKVVLCEPEALSEIAAEHTGH